MTAPHIVWFRRDQRLADQPALAVAMEAGPVTPVYVLDDETPAEGKDDRRMGGAQRWWLHHSLASLAADLEARGLRLILRRGRADEVLAGLADETGAAAVHAVRHWEPWWQIAQDRLGEQVDLRLYAGNYLHEIGTVRTGAGQPYRIYTPFWRALQDQLPPPEPTPAPDAIPAPDHWPKSDRLEDWDLLPTSPDWASGFRAEWEPGEAGAAKRLHAMIERIGVYSDCRNHPSADATSRLSPHLHMGDISAATVFHAIDAAADKATTEVFRKELAWRDFAQTLIVKVPDQGWLEANPRFPADHLYRDDREVRADLESWQQGRTGYPIVDAGMRELWVSGWMHNRLRLLTASFLTKHLLIEWQAGERWFWDTLCGADYGNNSTNWQWVAGSGVDAAPFHRMMAPLSQSEKFDAAGYIRRWVPELSHLSDRYIHDPGETVRPANYPPKMIAHMAARERAMAAWKEARADAVTRTPAKAGA